MSPSSCHDLRRSAVVTGVADLAPARTVGRGSRLPAAVALVVLLVALGLVIGFTTPWRIIDASVPGGRAPTDPSLYYSAAVRAREDAFHAAIHPSSYAALFLGWAAVLLLGFTPAGARLAGRLGRGRWPLVAALGGAAVVVVAWLVQLPFEARGHVVLRDYDLTLQGWGGWFADQGRSLGVSVVPVVIGVLAFYALVRRFPRTWWLPVSVAGAALVFLFSFLYPVVVEPVFNHFHPLPQGQLRSDLLAMARRDGVPVDDVLVADASRRTTTLNAYVSGYGGTRRIVLYDNLLRDVPPAQIEVIVAHELGHAKYDDVLHGTAIGALGVAAGLTAVFVLLSSPALLRRGGVRSARDPRSVALLVAVVTVLSTLSGPVQNLVSRQIEARADWHALQLTNDPQAFVAAMRSLAIRGLSDLDPNGAQYVWFVTHPTSPQRLAMAVDWARLHGMPIPLPLPAAR
jgi:STE24 endopeptidase